MVKECGLNYDDLEIMTIGMCLDYIEIYVERKNPDKEQTRKASQKDMDFF